MAAVPTLLLALLALLAAAPAASAATVVDRIVAQVNNEVITLSDLNARLKTVSPLMKGSLPPGTSVEMEVLNQLIEIELINQVARRMGIIVGEKEVDQAIESIKTENKINDAQFKASLAHEGQTVAGFRENIKFQILRDMVVRENLLRRIVVTDKEVDEYLSGAGANIVGVGEGATPIDKIRIIFLEHGSGGRDETMRRANELHAQIAEGALSFSEAARLHSKGMGAENGGDLGMTVGDLDERLGGLVRQMAPGSVSPPVDRGQDVLLIYIEPRAGASAPSATAKRSPSEYTVQQREAARRQLEQMKARSKFDDWLSDLKSKANIKVTL
jgi:peptidyl-prolyl cis-trans isomerase SurA